MSKKIPEGVPPVPKDAPPRSDSDAPPPNKSDLPPKRDTADENE